METLYIYADFDWKQTSYQISEVTTAISRWETIAKNLHISNEEMNRFAWRLDNVRLFL